MESLLELLLELKVSEHQKSLTTRENASSRSFSTLPLRFKNSRVSSICIEKDRLQGSSCYSQNCLPSLKSQVGKLNLHDDSIFEINAMTSRAMLWLFLSLHNHDSYSPLTWFWCFSLDLIFGRLVPPILSLFAYGSAFIISLAFVRDISRLTKTHQTRYSSSFKKKL